MSDLPESLEDRVDLMRSDTDRSMIGSTNLVDPGLFIKHAKGESEDDYQYAAGPE